MAAEGALPGDSLYGVKTTVEDVRLAVTPAEGDVSLHARFVPGAASTRSKPW